MDAYKVLSVNPSTASKLPRYDSASRPEAITPVNIDGMEDMMRQISGMEGSTGCLIIRIVAAMAICSGATLQLHGSMFVFGLTSIPLPSAILAIILGVALLAGLFGRATSLILVIGSVTALISEATANAGVAELTPDSIMMLTCGALTAIVAIIGTGRYTVPGLWHNLHKKQK